MWPLWLRVAACSRAKDDGMLEHSCKFESAFRGVAYGLGPFTHLVVGVVQGGGCSDPGFLVTLPRPVLGEQSVEENGPYKL